MEERVFLERSPREGDPATVRKNPSRFQSRGRTVGEKLKALLTEDNIEASIFEGQFDGVSQMPRNIGLDGTRYRNDLRIEIHTGYLRTGSKLRSRKPCNDSGSAGHIQNAVLFCEGHATYEIRRPGTKE